MKIFFTGPVVKSELLVAMLEKHGIAATQEYVDPAAPDDGDLDRPAHVLVPEGTSNARGSCSLPSGKTNCKGNRRQTGLPFRFAVMRGFHARCGIHAWPAVKC